MGHAADQTRKYKMEFRHAVRSRRRYLPQVPLLVCLGCEHPTKVLPMGSGGACCTSRADSQMCLRQVNVTTPSCPADCRLGRPLDAKARCLNVALNDLPSAHRSSSLSGGDAGILSISRGFGISLTPGPSNLPTIYIGSVEIANLPTITDRSVCHYSCHQLQQFTR